ncbi:MAG: NUDIX domain-containing protein, partial [Nocardioidaceae bacterium]
MNSSSGRGYPVAHEVLAVVVQVRAGELSVLLWRRAQQPYAGHWSLPGGLLGRESLDASIRRQLAEKVDVREVSHLEQLGTAGDPDRHPHARVLATSYLGLVRA